MTDMEKLVVAVTELRAVIGAEPVLNRRVYRAAKRVGRALRRHGIKSFRWFNRDNDHRGTLYIRRSGKLQQDSGSFQDWVDFDWLGAIARRLPDWLSHMASDRGEKLLYRDTTASKLEQIAETLEQSKKA